MQLTDAPYCRHSANEWMMAAGGNPKEVTQKQGFRGRLSQCSFLACFACDRRNNGKLDRAYRYAGSRSRLGKDQNNLSDERLGDAFNS